MKAAPFYPGLEAGQFKARVIRPTLALLGLGDGPAAENLLLGTALTESGLIYLAQLGGPALGLYQIELATHEDLHRNFLAFRPLLLAKLYPLRTGSLPDEFQLTTNLAYTTAVARLIYYRAKEPLPDAADAAGMAAYHKAHYNTTAGATDPTKSVANFARAIAVAT